MGQPDEEKVSNVYLEAAGELKNTGRNLQKFGISEG